MLFNRVLLFPDDTAVRMSVAEERYFIEAVCHYTDLSEEVALDELKLYWCMEMAQTDVIAAFSALDPDRIYVRPEKDVKDMLVPHVAHEIKHRAQLNKYSWLYFVFAIPVIRIWMLERDAVKIEEEVISKIKGRGFR